MHTLCNNTFCNTNWNFADLQETLFRSFSKITLNYINVQL